MRDVIDRFDTSRHRIDRLGAFVLWMAIGVGLGTLAALKRGRWQDRLATGFSVVGVSSRRFSRLMFIMTFVIWTGILPFPRYTGITENPSTGSWR